MSHKFVAARNDHVPWVIGSSHPSTNSAYHDADIRLTEPPHNQIELQQGHRRGSGPSLVRGKRQIDEDIEYGREGEQRVTYHGKNTIMTFE